MKTNLNYIYDTQEIEDSDDLTSVIWNILSEPEKRYLSGLEVGVDIELSEEIDELAEFDGEELYIPDIDSELGIVVSKKVTYGDIPPLVNMCGDWLESMTANPLFKEKLLSYGKLIEIVADSFVSMVQDISVGDETIYQTLFVECQDIIQVKRAGMIGG